MKHVFMFFVIRFDTDSEIKSKIILPYSLVFYLHLFVPEDALLSLFYILLWLITSC